MNNKFSRLLAGSLLCLSLEFPNSAKAQIAQGVPDLAVQAVSFSSTTTVMPSNDTIVESGRTVHLTTFRISNIGNAPSQSFRVVLYIDGRRSSSLTYAGLSAGPTIRQTLQIPRIRMGNHNLAVAVEKAPIISTRARTASGSPESVIVVPAILEQRPGQVEALHVDTTNCTLPSTAPISSGTPIAVPVDPGTPSPCSALTYPDADPSNNTQVIPINVSGSL